MGDETGEVEIAGKIYDAEGRVRGRRLEAPELVDHIPCAPTRIVRLHANGRLESCMLAGPLATTHGVLPAGSVVGFDDFGRLVRAVVSADCVLGTRAFASGDSVSFPQDGPPRKD